MWSAVTKRVSVVPVTLTGTRGTVPEDDVVDEDEVVVDAVVVDDVVVDDDEEDDPPVLVVPVLVVPVLVAGFEEEQAAETATPAVATKPIPGATARRRRRT
jgi:hypothetical protein